MAQVDGLYFYYALSIKKALLFSKKIPSLFVKHFQKFPHLDLKIIACFVQFFPTYVFLVPTSAGEGPHLTQHGVFILTN